MYDKHVEHLLPADPEIRRIEQRAAQVLMQCQQTLQLNTLPIPIPVDRWIENPLDIAFGIADLSHLGQEVLGAAFCKEREILISETALTPEGRYRFTCAHELGHLILHGQDQVLFRDPAKTFLRDIDAFERQANRFAAAFLMPISLLAGEILKIADASGLSRKLYLSELSRDSPRTELLWRDQVLPRIAMQFGVSRSAAMYRMTELESQGQTLMPRPTLKRLSTILYGTH